MSQPVILPSVVEVKATAFAEVREMPALFRRDAGCQDAYFCDFHSLLFFR